MSEPSFSVALVEDEAILRQELAFQLEHLGFDVQAFDSASGLYRYLATRPRVVVLLDIGLPGEDGLSICRHLRAHDPQMGIVFLTARGLRDERLEGLTNGADAYLVKPVDLDELTLVLRRLAERFPDIPSAPGSGATDHAWHIDLQSSHLVTPNERRLRLSFNETQLLKVLIAHRDQVCSHGKLLAAIGFAADEVERHRVEVIISRMRKKVERECGLPLPVKAIRGQGYVFDSVA